MKRRLSAYLQHLEPNIGSKNGSMEETILRGDLIDDHVQGMSDDEQEEPEKENDLIVDPLQDERIENTITSDSEWNMCVNKCNFDHWNLLSTPIKSMMDEILKFTTAAQLSESNLKNMLGLLHTNTKQPSRRLFQIIEPERFL